MQPDPFSAASDAAAVLSRSMGGEPHDVAVVLGSGWGGAVSELGEADACLPMSGVPGFAVPEVAGHAGTISSVPVGSHRVLVLAGRCHLYEGHDAVRVVHGVRTAVLAGCGIVILTNAAGSLRPGDAPGCAVAISDHLNLTGRSPLVGGAPPEPYPPRFADLSDAYSSRLRALARRVDPALTEGVYAAMLGGAYETPAEIRMLRTLGADLVGMSTALETIAAVHLGAEVLGISLVTNLAAGLSVGPIDHREVLVTGAEAAQNLTRLLRDVILAL